MARKNLTSTGSNGSEGTKFGNQLLQQFKYGDVAWIKTRGCSWWPAQVVNEENVSDKPRKKAKEEVLVRMYGTYEYHYVDPVKSNSEFESFLKQENITSKEAFLKTLVENLSRVKSGGRSKRKVSEPKDDGPKGKKPKQDGIQRIREADNHSLPRASSGKQKQTRSEKEKEKGNVKSKASRDNKQNKNEARDQRVATKAKHGAAKEQNLKQNGPEKPNESENTKVGASKMENTKQRALGKPRQKNPKKEIPIKARGRAKKDGLGKAKGVVKARTRPSKIKETGQDALEKDSSHVKSGGSSKRKFPDSRENTTADAPKGKKQKQNKMERSQKADNHISPGASSDEQKETKPEAKKGTPRRKDKAHEQKSAKQGGARKSNEAEKVRNQTSKVNNRKQVALEKSKPDVAKGKTARKARDGASEGKSAEKDGAGKVIAKGKARTRASKIKQDASEAMQTNAKEQLKGKVRGKVRDEASKSKAIKQDGEGKGKKSDNGRTRPSKSKLTKQTLKVSKHTDAKGQITGKVGDEAFKGKTVKQGVEGKPSKAEKGRNEISKLKDTKQNSLDGPKHTIVRDHSKTESPVSVKNNATEETTPNLSARRIRVMQNLGLIAPLGSPFRRNGPVVA